MRHLHQNLVHNFNTVYFGVQFAKEHQLSVLRTVCVEGVVGRCRRKRSKHKGLM